VNELGPLFRIVRENRLEFRIPHRFGRGAVSQFAVHAGFNESVQLNDGFFGSHVGILPMFNRGNVQPPADADLASFWNKAIRFRSVRKLRPSMAAACVRLLFTCCRVSLM
jgi:hypothetical protein